MRTYQGIENRVVGAYKKIEDKFVDTFLERIEPEGKAEEYADGENNR